MATVSCDSDGSHGENNDAAEEVPFPAPCPQTNLPGTTYMISNHGWLRLPELNGMSNGVFDSWFEMSANTTVVDTGYDFFHV